MFWQKWLKSGTGDISLLSKETEFLGDISFSGTLRIEGKIQGLLKSDGSAPANLVLGHESSVVGPVWVDNIKIGGVLKGNVHASQRVEVLSSGYLEGNVYSTDLEIQKGGQFKGTCYKYTEAKRPAKATITPPPKPSVRQLSVRKAASSLQQ